MTFAMWQNLIISDRLKAEVQVFMTLKVGTRSISDIEKEEKMRIKNSSHFNMMAKPGVSEHLNSFCIERTVMSFCDNTTVFF